VKDKSLEAAGNICTDAGVPLSEQILLNWRKFSCFLWNVVGWMGGRCRSEEWEKRKKRQKKEEGRGNGEALQGEGGLCLSVNKAKLY
jgi:hypothetical protein